MRDHPVMANTLQSASVLATLARLRQTAIEEDEPAKLRLREQERIAGERLYGMRRAEIYADAPLAIADEVGRLLYLLAVSRGPGLAIEFGSSLGLSTIYLAAGLRDGAGGRLITTELMPSKVSLAEANLKAAGLGELVEVREGDALQTLADVERVGLLFLDGWNDLYLPLLSMLEPKLEEASIVIADISAGDPHLLRYVEYVRDPAHGYISMGLPLDEGVEISLRLGGSNTAQTPL